MTPASQHVAAQDVVRVEFLAAFEQCHARAQVVELGAGAVHDGQRPAFTRSSRLTPSHMAMAAATNTDE
jgi:hypothetical protein